MVFYFYKSANTSLNIDRRISNKETSEYHFHLAILMKNGMGIALHHIGIYLIIFVHMTRYILHLVDFAE